MRTFVDITTGPGNLMHNACNLVSLQECHRLASFKRKIHTGVEVLNEIRLIINTFWCIKCVNKAWTDWCTVAPESSMIFPHLWIIYIHPFQFAFYWKLEKHSIRHWVRYYDYWKRLIDHQNGYGSVIDHRKFHMSSTERRMRGIASFSNCRSDVHWIFKENRCQRVNCPLPPKTGVTVPYDFAG